MTTSDDILTFSSKSSDASVRCLSNFAPLAVKVDEIEYPTGEHAFHGCKFLFCAQKLDASSARAKALQTRAQLFAHPSSFETALDAKRAGGKSKKYGFALSDDELVGWHQEATRVQKQICRYKITHYQQVQQVLAATTDKLLLHQENRAKTTTPWGGRVDPAKKGQKILTAQDIIGRNGLGRIWMKLRSEAGNYGEKRQSADKDANADSDDAGRDKKKLKTGERDAA